MSREQRKPTNIFWFRRDLRLSDNAGLYAALSSNREVLPVFIFDKNILDKLEDKDDARLTFIHDQLTRLNNVLWEKYGSGIHTFYGTPEEIYEELSRKHMIESVYTNEDYEPYARERDDLVSGIVDLKTYKDQVVFAKDEVLKDDGSPYTVYTPYMKKYRKLLTETDYALHPSEGKLDNLVKGKGHIIPLSDLGFERSTIEVRKYSTEQDLLTRYPKERDLPYRQATSALSPHLRFGTVSIREIFRNTVGKYESFVNELIWREFFMQILYHFPRVTDGNFKKKYDAVEWENDEIMFEKWCNGHTGYPMVDAGMRELNKTGIMHNRVRMVVASFLCKHLLIDWRWGEVYFARKLLDFELSSNNGNWQWAAGTGCDAAPYFRVFNPESQREKFDPHWKYVKKWVPEINTSSYPKPIVDHKQARERAIERYKIAVSGQ